MRKINKIKPEIRILGVDDSPFSFEDENVKIICSVFRGANYIDGLISFDIEKDGDDFSEKLIENINNSRHKEQLQLIMLDGITFGGFNVADIHLISQKTDLPVIVAIRKKPEMEKFIEALKKVDASQVEKIKKVGEVKEINLGRNKVYVQLANMSLKEAEEILQLTCIHSNIPEPIRVSHLISTGIYFGENKPGA